MLKQFLKLGIFLLLVIVTVPVTAANVVATVPSEKIIDPKAQQLLQRLDQIKQMDKTELSSSERKSLRKEVKGIRSELKTINNGVYLSVGAIIIIILLLILIL